MASVTVNAVLSVAIWLGSLLETQVFGVVPSDVRTLVGMMTVVGVACITATWLQARVAARVDPAQLLRSEY